MTSKKIVYGLPGCEDFGFSFQVAHFRSAEIAICCYLFIFKTVSRSIFNLSPQNYFRPQPRSNSSFISFHTYTFHLVYTFHSTFDAHDTHSLRYDAINELKMRWSPLGINGSTCFGSSMTLKRKDMKYQYQCQGRRPRPQIRSTQWSSKTILSLWKYFEKATMLYCK